MRAKFTSKGKIRLVCAMQPATSCGDRFFVGRGLSLEGIRKFAMSLSKWITLMRGFPLFWTVVLIQWIRRCIHVVQLTVSSSKIRCLVFSDFIGIKYHLRRVSLFNLDYSTLLDLHWRLIQWRQGTIQTAHSSKLRDAEISCTWTTILIARKMTWLIDQSFT